MPSPFPSFADSEMTVLAANVAQRRITFYDRALETNPQALLQGLPAQAASNALRGIAADEGTVWLSMDGGTSLVPIWNNGPDAGRMVGSFRLASNQGITGWVFTSGMASCESEVCLNQQQHRELDRTLGVLTWAMLAVPLRLADERRGVFTAVRLIRLDALPDLQTVPLNRQDFPSDFVPPDSFSVDDLASIEVAAQIIGRLVDHRLTAWALGWEE